VHDPTTDQATFRRLIRERLPALSIPPARQAAVEAELAQLLADAWERSGRPTSQGQPTVEELEAWLDAEVPSWERLASDLASIDHPVTGGLRRRLADRPSTPWLETPGPEGRRGAAFMSGFWGDIRFAVRTLVKHRAFTGAALVTLALGIGLNTSIFSLINGLLLRPHTVHDPDRLINVYTAGEGDFTSHEPMAYPDVESVGAAESLSGITAYSMVPMVIDGGGAARSSMGVLVTGEYFSVLGVDAALGRVLTPEDARPGAEAVAVLEHDAWRRLFGADPDVLGRTVRINGEPVTIVGVAARGFKGLQKPLSPDVWVPMTSRRMAIVDAALSSGDSEEGEDDGPDLMADRGSRWVLATARVAPGVSVEQAMTEVSGIGDRLAETFPETNEERRLTAVPTSRVRTLPGVDRALRVGAGVVLGLVGLVLLIACANVASLVLARSASRQREIATRMSLGAGRRRLVRQLLVESLMLSLLGGALGLLLAHLSNRLLTSIHLVHMPIPVNLNLGLALDRRVILFTLGAAVVTTVVFGLVPALRAARLDPAAGLRDGSGGSRDRRRLHRTLVVVQVALSVVLLIAAGLSLRSVVNAQQIDPGFDSRGVVVARFSPQLQGYDATETRALLDRLEGEIEVLPGVRSASWTDLLPLSMAVRTQRAAPEADWATDESEWSSIDTATVGPDYFEVLGIELLRGRGFTERDRATSVPVTVVNDELARRFWPGETALGKRIRAGGDDREYEVVGVVRGGKYRTLGEDPRPFFYRAAGQDLIGAPTLVARVDGDPAAAIEAIRGTVRRVDPALVMTGLETMGQAVSGSLLLVRTGAVLFGLFGALGLVLAAVGVYGLIAFTVSQRTHEIGIRMAIGASRRDVTRLVVREGAILAVLGLAFGLVGAAAFTRVLAAVLYGVSPTDPLTFGAVALLLALVAGGASLAPARRAAAIDPQTALRTE